MVNVTRVDLNLFRVLDAVLSEGSAVKASQRLGVGQPAVSNALARLRELFGDPLVVRTGRGLAPTARALELQPQISEALRKLEHALAGEESFRPEVCTRTFTLAAADNHSACEVPKVMPLFRKRLPKARLRVVSPDFLVASDGLASGEVDAVFAPRLAMRPGDHARPLFEEEGALVVRRGHAAARGRVSKSQLSKLEHIDFHIAQGRGGTGDRVAAQHWRRLGIRREVVLAVPSFTAAVMTAAQTDLVAAVPRRVAETFARILPIAVLEVAFPLPRMTTVQGWNARSHNDPAARAFRQVVVDALSEFPAEPRQRA